MDEGADSIEQELFESNEEVNLQTLALRRFDRVRRPIERYSPPDFRSAFVLFVVNDEPRLVKEAVSFEECKL